MEDVKTETISSIVDRVATALEAAAAAHGPEAVDLALMAYRVNAIQEIAVGAALLLFAGLVVWGNVKMWRWAVARDLVGGPDVVFFGMGSGVSLLVVLVSAAKSAERLFSAPNWMAASGSPEILIATRALQAAGLM